MLLFRSEEHLEAWLAESRLSRGQTLTLGQQWHLAQLWYSNRMEAGWRRRDPNEAQAIFAEVGLTGEFWNLTAPTR